MDTFEQQVINDNKEIYSKIQYELLKAKSQILLATAWFTDDHLFSILSNKLDQGVAIEIIIADNQDNERLDFSLLVSKGAAVYKIKNSGYGIMNQKFCVIDKVIALHGSYNWTLNAKKNNHESIISTNHQETIDSLIENFNNIKNKILEQKTESNDTGSLSDHRSDHKDVMADQPLKAGTEFEKVLDSMIAAEIGSFDRKLLREQGFQRCSANNGDHNVLYKSFDTLYSVFINDIDVIDDKKKRLISKIEEYALKSKNALEKKCELHINFLEQENTITKNNLEIKKIKIDADIESISKNITDTKENKITLREKESEDLNTQIKSIEQLCVRPVFKWFEFIPTAIFNIALLIYIFIFYSSAAYILLFSAEDAKENAAQNIPSPAAQIFNASALTQVLTKTPTATFFIFLFVFIPLAFSIIDQFVNIKWKTLASISGILFGIIIMDGAIAYKVTQAVHEVNYIQGFTNEPWKAMMAFSDINFYLVLVFGTFGLISFKLVFKKMISIFEERSPDTIAQKNQLKIKQIKEEITATSSKIILLRENLTALEINVIQLKTDKKHADLELKELPLRLNQDLQKRKNQLLKDLENIDKITTIYTIHIQSDNLPVSIDALKDRINIFLEGWNDFLHKEYAIAKATSKTAQAAEVAAEWQTEKLYTNKVDKRVKIAQNV